MFNFIYLFMYNLFIFHQLPLECLGVKLLTNCYPFAGLVASINKMCYKSSNFKTKIFVRLFHK